MWTKTEKPSKRNRKEKDSMKSAQGGRRCSVEPRNPVRREAKKRKRERERERGGGEK